MFLTIFNVFNLTSIMSIWTSYLCCFSNRQILFCRVLFLLNNNCLLCKCLDIINWQLLLRQCMWKWQMLTTNLVRCGRPCGLQPAPYPLGQSPIPGVGTSILGDGRDVLQWWPPFWGFSIRLGPYFMPHHDLIDPLFLQKNWFISYHI